MIKSDISMNRRNFLSGTVGVASAALTFNGANAKSYGEVVEEQPFARLEKLRPNIWAAVSKPFNDDGSFNMKALQTACNGGIIAGQDRVVAIEGFMQPAGSAWLAAKALELTGRPVTDVIVTHFHSDHTGGLAGFQNGAEGPEIIATDTSRKLIFERYAGPHPVENSPFSIPIIRPVLPTRIITDEVKSSTLDLGGRTVTLDPTDGHTPSDLAIWVDDEPVVFVGDLVWAGIFPNYVDAIPSKLRKSVVALLKDSNNIVVTGHGYVAKAKNLGTYVDLLDFVEEKARAAHEAGKTPTEGASQFILPESLGIWHKFAPDYYEVAFEAWWRELDGS